MENGFIVWLNATVNAVNGVLWSSFMSYFLIGVGILYTVALCFPQIRGFGHMWHVVLSGRKNKGQGISSFQALCTSLAAQVGTGNIAGVATALVAGGPGAVFWMWVSAMIGMATIYGEAILAQIYRVKDNSGQYRGGPAYYIERGLGSRGLGICFAVSLIIAMPFIFNAAQSNSIASGMRGAWQFNPQIVAAVVIVFTAIVIFGGLKRIAHVAEVIVPLMAFAYLILAIVVVALNISKVPSIIGMIVSYAFNGGPQQVAGGVLGFTIAKAFRYGVARGLFSNEAGMGSTPNANAVAEVGHPARQGYSAMMGVFVDTMVICTCTAMIILIFGDLSGTQTGVELTQIALTSEIGHLGAKFIAIALMFFAWTSILGNYYYGETNLKYIFPNTNNLGLAVYRIIVLGFIYFGAVNHVDLIWNLADTFNGIMALINLLALVLLVGIVIRVSRDYDRRRKLGEEDPYLDRDQIIITAPSVTLPSGGKQER